MEPTPEFRVVSDEYEKPCIGQEWILTTFRSATSVHLTSQTKQGNLSSRTRLLIDLGKRLVQMFSHLKVQTTSVWLTTNQATSK